MGVIAQVEIPAKEFALGTTLEKAPRVEFDIEQVVAHGTDHVFPFVWAIGDDLESLEDLLREDPDVNDSELLAELEDRRLYRMDWVAHIRLIVRIVIEEKTTILDAHGKDERWKLRILFPDHGALSRTREFCERNGIPFDVKAVYRLSEGKQRMFGLTQEQYEALVAATKRGYYDVPRAIDADSLAAELGITPQALSERLRRGQRTLNRNTLGIGSEPDSDHDG
ncbi:helix-turn-helix domain-containing protein [Haladaptatus salinisoli]|uniref:helix-turn-helix domain-containing protein n=1 Tax=Haladaptatus salinisoli TaxID=2884876 RepID=UPI001D0A0F58|nr:helix-turn-helix domain-containing protein [Haladaptatus salinisoli]